VSAFGGRRPTRGALVAIGLGAVAILGALAIGRPGQDGPPLDPRSDGALGTSALVALLDELGAEVDLSVGLPGPSDEIALLLQDRLDEDQRASLQDWVSAGGTLVVTDPLSPLTPNVADSGWLPSEDALAPGRCTIEALDGIGEVEAGAASRFEADDGDDVCFADDDGAFVVARSLGAGDVVGIGGAAFATNELLDEADNAVLAANLLVPQAAVTVRFVEAPIPAGGGDQTLTDLVPAGVKRALLQLGIAFVLYAVWRAIRLGQPVAETQPVQLAGSELVSAVGRLLARTRSPGAAAATLRAALRRRLRSRLGIPQEVPPDALAELTAARTGVDADTVRTALADTPVDTDAELVAVAQAAATINQEVRRD
jgi:hypothetical protein